MLSLSCTCLDSVVSWQYSGAVLQKACMGSARNRQREHEANIGITTLGRMSQLRFRVYLKRPALAASLIAVFFALAVLRVFPDPSPSDSEQTCWARQRSDECLATPPPVTADPVQLVVVGLSVLPRCLVPRAAIITSEVSDRAPPTAVPA